MIDFFFSVIKFVARDLTILNITCWKGTLVQQFLGCSMKQCHSEFEDKNDLLSGDKIQKMINIVDKRQNYVNSTVKDSYKDDKRHINLVSFEWV